MTMRSVWDVPKNLHPNPVINRELRRRAALEQARYRVPISFAIVGVQKAGTSTLYKALAMHPDIASGPEKEMRLFIQEDIDWSRPSYADYVRPAMKPTKRTAGDATPEYLFWPHALERMHAYNPELPLLATLRDPIERAFSQWSMERRRDASFPELPEAIARWADARIPDDIPGGVTPYELRRRSLFTRGLYGQQIERGLRYFPRQQWLFFDLTEIADDLTGVLDRATDHLGLRRFDTYPPARRRNRTPTDNSGPAPTVEDIQRLVDLYRDDLPRVAELTGLEIGRWPTVRVLNGQLSVAELREGLIAKLGLAE